VAKLGATAAIAIAAALALAGAARAAVVLAGNSRGDQVLVQRVLDQRTRPLYAATRAPGGAFGPLSPLTSAGRPFIPNATVDDNGGAIAAISALDPFGVQPAVSQIAIQTPGASFAAPSDVAPVGPVDLTANASGDAIVAGGGLYRFRPRGGEFGPATDLPSENPSASVFAVDPDGSVAYFWRESSTAFNDPRGFESVRPPGGEFGPPTPIADLALRHDLAQVAVSDGRVLVVWHSDASIVGAEREPGGQFGPPFKVADSPLPFFNLFDVAIARSGAAAVAFGYFNTYIASRDPGGSFGAPQRALGGEGRVAVGDAGDAVAGWQREDHRVVVAYRPHGGGFGKAFVVAAARPFAPGPVDPPALVIDGAGKATAAWEQSNGAKVATFARSFDGTRLGRVARVGVLPSFVREGPPSACRPARKSDLLARTSEATVFWNDALYGCLLARGAPVKLPSSDDDSPQLGSIALAGPLVAHADDYLAHSTALTTVNVTDLRDRDSGLSRIVLAEPGDTIAVVPAIRLKRNGAFAFTEYPEDAPGRVRVKVCDAQSSRVRVVDSGRGIAPRTLRLEGSRLTWKHGKRLRHATLR
jgi:hypothetical protein